MIDVVLRAIPWDQSPFAVSSHAVDTVDDPNIEGRRLLRITLFSRFDYDNWLTQSLASKGIVDHNPPRITDFVSSDVKIELPFAAAELLGEPNFRLNGETIKFRVTGTADVVPGLLEKSQTLLGQLPLQLQYLIRALFSFRSAMRTAETNVQFEHLGDFFAAVSNAQMNYAETQAMLAQLQGQAQGQAQHQHFNARRRFLPDIKDEFFDLTAAPIGNRLKQRMRFLPVLALQSGQSGLYEAVRRNVLGLRSVHLQLYDFVAVLQLIGLDLFPFLPPVPNQN